MTNDPSLFDYRAIVCTTKSQVDAELRKREIPTTPLVTIRDFGHPYYVALYPSNGYNTIFAIQNGTTLHILSACDLELLGGHSDFGTDASALRDTLLATAIGGTWLGSFVGHTSGPVKSVIHNLDFSWREKRTGKIINIVGGRNEKCTNEVFGVITDRFSNVSLYFADRISGKITNRELANYIIMREMHVINPALTDQFLRAKGLNPNGLINQ